MTTRESNADEVTAEDREYALTISRADWTDERIASVAQRFAEHRRHVTASLREQLTAATEELARKDADLLAASKGAWHIAIERDAATARATELERDLVEARERLAKERSAHSLFLAGGRIHLDEHERVVAELAACRRDAMEMRRRAYVAGYDFGYDHAEVSEHDGYHKHDPRIDWPTDEDVRNAATAYAAATETVVLEPAAQHQSAPSEREAPAESGPGVMHHAPGCDCGYSMCAPKPAEATGAELPNSEVALGRRLRVLLESAPTLETIAEVEKLTVAFSSCPACGAEPWCNRLDCKTCSVMSAMEAAKRIEDDADARHAASLAAAHAKPTPAEATASGPAPVGDPSAETLTLFEAQRHQPWTVPYGEHKWWVVNDEGRLKHCLAHATKSIGKVAAAIERLDHSNSGWLSDAECDAVGDMAADLVSVALQIGTAVRRSVAHALVRRVKEKNGAVLDPKGGTYGRALICK